MLGLPSLLPPPRAPAPLQPCRRPLQFGKYLVENQRPDWSEQYVGKSCAARRGQMPLASCRVLATPVVPASPQPTMDSAALRCPHVSADYKALKDLIKKAAEEARKVGTVPFHRWLRPAAARAVAPACLQCMWHCTS